MNYTTAEVSLMQGKTIRRESWPEGKVAFYDKDNDNIPDTLDTTHPDFLENSKRNYDLFKMSIKISVDGVVKERVWITQEDAISNDWIVL